METKAPQTKQDNEILLNRKEHHTYSSVVGGMLNAAVSTRPDLSFPVRIISRQMNALTSCHMPLAKRVLRYIYGTIKQDIT